MPDIAAGVVKFQKEVYPNKKELFEKLSTGQEPETLFITCSDSRVDPNLITQTDPGELFICRNAGNIVPPHTNNTGAMTASIEYAVAVLNVKHIVVCGHSKCGAMTGAMDPESVKALPHVTEWLGYSRAAVQIMEEKFKDKNLSNEEKLDHLIRENILLQIQHLKTHPHVAVKLATQEVILHGWFYDIRSGGVTAYDEETDTFLPVEECYAGYLKDLMHAHH